MKLILSTKALLADTITPVSAYLRLRDVFPTTLLLESNDYRGSVNSRSFICADSIAEFCVKDSGQSKVADSLEKFLASFQVHPASEDTAMGTIPSGAFGHTSYDAVELFEDVQFQKGSHAIPLVRYDVYRYVIAFDHFYNKVTLAVFCEESEKDAARHLRTLETLVFGPSPAPLSFSRRGEEQQSADAGDFKKRVEICKQHIARGDIFQVVPSIRYSQGYEGDDFRVYRALRSLNPSPYLFYFDYGDYRIFGSSPEAHLLVKNKKASIHPIAGTYKRSGNELEDAARAKELSEDEKENAEHVMLVDLARNDLSRYCRDVEVVSFKEIQFYSHVIHLVSEVRGGVPEGVSAPRLVAASLPAGTLSGAPKIRAMQIIDSLEPLRREFYGGALGFYGFQGDCTHAIIIRSFLSKDKTLHFQAGAGIVSDSDPQREFEEIGNKLGAPRRAIQMAEDL